MAKKGLNPPSGRSLGSHAPIKDATREAHSRWAKTIYSQLVSDHRDHCAAVPGDRRGHLRECAAGDAATAAAATATTTTPYLRPRPRHSARR